MNDYMIRATAAEGQIRAFAATTRALLAEKHKQTDWNDRESVHAYNEYARMLRKQVGYDE